MSVIDDFTSYHEQLLEGHYDCVDRIVVNAYFEYAQSAGGFRSWWRTLTGSDETLDRAHLERMKRWTYIKHYYVHLMDPEWGHVTIRICGYRPFGAQVIANGHEWVERQARKRSLPIAKEGNCFTGGTDFQALNQIAKTLRASHAVGRLTKVCDRWLYSACLCFALDSEEQKRTKFQYQYSF